MKATDLASVGIGVIYRPDKLPIAIFIVYDSHDRRLVLDNASANKYLLVRVNTERPRGVYKFPVIDVVHHTSSKQIRFVQQWLGSAKNGLILPWIRAILCWPEALNSREFRSAVKPDCPAEQVSKPKLLNVTAPTALPFEHPIMLPTRAERYSVPNILSDPVQD